MLDLPDGHNQRPYLSGCSDKSDIAVPENQEHKVLKLSKEHFRLLLKYISDVTSTWLSEAEVVTGGVGLDLTG